MEEYRKKLRDLRSKFKEAAAVAAVYVLLIVFGFCFYDLGIVQRQELKIYDNRVTLIRTDGNAYSCPEAEQMRLRNQEAEVPFSYALWGDEGVRLLQNLDLGRDTQAEVYVVEGSSDLLLSSTVILDGMVGKSCLIGEEAAQALFGVADATGLSLTMDSSRYVVLGMLKDGAQGAVFLAKDLDTSALDRMNVRVSGDVALSSLERSVKGQLGFSGTALDYRFINSLIGLLGLGLFLLLWIWLLRLMAAELKAYRKQNIQVAEYVGNGNKMAPVYVKGLAIRLGCILGIAVILVVFLCSQVKIPEDMIPTKWSDFEFWNRWIAEKAERMSVWIRCEKRASELLYLGKTVRAALWLALSYLCYIVLRAIQFGRNSIRKTRK